MDDEYAAQPYKCPCQSICRSFCECANCDAHKLYSVSTDVEEAVKEIFERKILIEILVQSRSNLKVEGVLCDRYLTSSWGWRGVVDKVFAVLETAYETLDRLNMQFAGDHFESDIAGGQGYHSYNHSSDYDGGFFWDGCSWDVSSWDRVERDRCCRWWRVRFVLFSNSIW